MHRFLTRLGGAAAPSDFIVEAERRPGRLKIRRFGRLVRIDTQDKSIERSLLGLDEKELARLLLDRGAAQGFTDQDAERCGA